MITGCTSVVISETPTQNKPVASPAAHSLLANASSGGKMSMGPHHYVPSIPVNINTTQPHYNSLVTIARYLVQRPARKKSFSYYVVTRSFEFSATSGWKQAARIAAQRDSTHRHAFRTDSVSLLRLALYMEICVLFLDLHGNFVDIFSLLHVYRASIKLQGYFNSL